MYSLAIIDDNPTDIRLLRMALDKSGLLYECRNILDSHKIGSLLAAADPPDVIITDASIPGVDLAELIRELKSSPQLMSVPLIVLSGSMDPELVENSLARGAADYIVKPADLEGWFKLGRRLKLIIETLLR